MQYQLSRIVAGPFLYTLGRPKVGSRREDALRARLTAGDGMLKVARTLGVGVSTVRRVKAEMAAAPAR